MRQVETVIVGGGPAGAAVACGLAALDREVVLLERADGPHHKVCGEFLSIETQTQLFRLGVDPSALGAVPIEQVAVYASTLGVTAALPFRGLSLSRSRLDEALLRRAQSRGAEMKRGVAVRGAAPARGGWMVECGAGETLHCRRLVLATGKWGLRGLPESRDGSLVGLKMHFRPSTEVRRALAARVELSLLEGGYAGLELIEDGIANLCVLLPRAAVAGLAPGWPSLQDYLTAARPDLAERLSGAEPLWSKPVAVVCPTGGHLQADGEPAVYRVGDRLAHIPPFTGDGLAIALGSAAVAVEHIRRGEPSAAYLRAAQRLTGKAIRLATAISAIAASPAGRTVLMGAAACAPGILGAIARQTRFPLAAS